MTEPLHLSISGILTFRLCQRQYQFKNVQHLAINRAPNDAMVSGRVVDEALTLRLQGDTRSNEALVDEQLRREFDGDQKKIDRFTRGALNAVSKCPKWILEHDDWHVQEPAELHLDVAKFDLIQPVILHMRPDIWRLDPDKGIILLDFKTTDNEPLEYQLWEPQLRYYALHFMDADPTTTVWFRYVTLPTQGKTVHEHEPWVFSARSEAAARRDLLYTVQLMVEQGTDSDIPTYARMICRWCDYAPICTAIITGADPKGIIEETYHVRERYGS